MAVTDPLPAGFEPVESWFATTAALVTSRPEQQEESERTWQSWWERGGFDHVERHDDRVLLFATRSERRASRVLLRRPSDDGRDVPNGSGAGGGDVSAGGVRAHGNDSSHGEVAMWLPPLGPMRSPSSLCVGFRL